MKLRRVLLQPVIDGVPDIHIGGLRINFKRFFLRQYIIITFVIYLFIS